eukprot:TRINITY_DN121295_c0_g1_i1.p1 TRINITY_DN121295_c0_g1~~TRINITY_DN121295_c0_g1_i1.p1  ORF type:complete len:174 (-),score=35.67 TRINITY_DN121295_c0_g1_i1:152-673(-)
MEHLLKKYGKQAVETFSKPGNPLDEAGGNVGITFNKQRRIIPTVEVHCVVEWAKEVGGTTAVDELMETLFNDYFEKGTDVSKRDALVSCVERVPSLRGKGEEVRAFLDSSDGRRLASETAQKAASWSSRGVSGVPFFVLEPQDAQGSVRPIAFSGAQPSDVIAQQLRKLSCSL